MIIKNKEYKDYTFVMAIINLTPDSFFKESRKDEYTVLKAVEKAVCDGASIIDLGVQSTRPGYVEVSAEEEISRLEKPLYLIKKNFDIPISVDTYFSKTANLALCAGADLINDIWGFQVDGDMAKTVAKYNASACLMHNAKTLLSGDMWGAISSFLQKSVKIALDAGVDKNKICLDGGIGFAKSKEQNFQLLNGYNNLNALGYPLLLGASRKSMFGGRVEDRLEATLNATRLAAKMGVLFVRVHDVKENFDAIRSVYEQGIN
ncbi:MAG: dihydropteroate synthase [Clostridiales bacterium]|nr:dihydropteroate synthase [Clostridiales bacterium]